MPVLNIEDVHVAKLKELNIYDKWIWNVKTQWDTRCTDPVHISNFKSHDTHDLLRRSFKFSDSKEGTKYWSDILKQLKNS